MANKRFTMDKRTLEVLSWLIDPDRLIDWGRTESERIELAAVGQVMKAYISNEAKDGRQPERHWTKEIRFVTDKLAPRLPKPTDYYYTVRPDERMELIQVIMQVQAAQAQRNEEETF